MHIDIHCRGFDLTDSLREYTYKRLADSLDHGETRIRRVIVRLSDINGPRGGEDKRCQLELKLQGFPAIVIQETQSELYTAISRAAERAGRTLSRRIEQNRRSQFDARRYMRPLMEQFDAS